MYIVHVSVFFISASNLLPGLVVECYNFNTTFLLIFKVKPLLLKAHIYDKLDVQNNCNYEQRNYRTFNEDEA